MGLEFLVRVRRTCIWLSAITGLMVATYRGPVQGLAVLLGAAWSLINLFLIEKLVVAVTGEDRGRTAAVLRAAWSMAGMFGLFVAGAVMLSHLPPLWWAIGFVTPFVVIFLKAVSLLLLPSSLWQRVTRSPWRAALVVTILALGAWWAATGWGGTQAAPAAAGRTAASGAAHGGAAAPAARVRDATPAAAARAAGGGHAATAERGEGEGPQKFPNLITVLTRRFPDASWVHFLHRNEPIAFSLLVAFVLCLAAFAAALNPRMIPGTFQNVVEMVVEGLYNFVVGILGPTHGPRYVPFLGTLFVYILAMNLFGLIPFMESPTSNLNVTVGLALVVFVFAQFIGFRELGVIGYFDHMMGNPRRVTDWLLAPLMLPIHVMGELAKPISLSCRLFGNIFGEDMLLVAFAALGVSALAFTHLPFGLPLQLPFMFLALLTSTLQALVFTVLSTIYFLLMLPHDEPAHEREAHHAR
jgi:F-type H+-transporting ATPase subunit a